MKIVHVLPNLNLEGAQNFIVSLSKEQKKNKELKIEIWCLSHSEKNYLENENEIIWNLKSNGIDVYFLDNEKRNRFLRIKNLFKNYKRFQPEIINAHIFHTVLYCLIIKLIFFYKKINLIETIHSTKIGDGVLRYICNNFIIDKTISINSSITKILKNKLKISEEKIIEIQNGIQVLENKIKINEKAKNIICVGRLENVKNHKFIIEAYSYMKHILKEKEIPNLYIYGEGSLKNELEETIKKNQLGQEVKLCGVSTKIRKNLLENDIYVIPSKYEGLSISLLEAMEVGIPIIATNVNGNKEILEKNKDSLLVEEGDIKGMANSIIKLKNDLFLRKMFSKNSIEKIKEYDLKNTSKKYIELYRKLINTR